MLNFFEYHTMLDNLLVEFNEIFLVFQKNFSIFQCTKKMCQKTGQFVLGISGFFYVYIFCL